jgi:hypothetical protein
MPGAAFSIATIHELELLSRFVPDTISDAESIEVGCAAFLDPF